MVISDNGASSEGGPTGSIDESKFINNVPEYVEDNLTSRINLGSRDLQPLCMRLDICWKYPLQPRKRETYRGGISDPFIVHWPRRI